MEVFNELEENDMIGEKFHSYLFERQDERNRNDKEMDEWNTMENKIHSGVRVN